jgi:hypothetical protein
MYVEILAFKPSYYFIFSRMHIYIYEFQLISVELHKIPLISMDFT